MRIGQVFRVVTSNKGERKEVELLVVKIITYRRELDELSTGLTGDLHVEGGVSLLGHGDMLGAVTCSEKFVPMGV